MREPTQALLVRFAVATSVFALMIAAVAVSGDKGSSGSGTVTSGPIALALTEFALAPAAITVAKGGSIAVTNNGTMDHDLAVLDTAVKTRDLKAGESQTLDVSALKPGQYEMFCAVPGHKD